MRLPHLVPFDRCPLYYFTACTSSRRPVLACKEAFSALIAVWEKSPACDDWHVGRFVIMPDHVHFFAQAGPWAKARGEWHKTWKGVTARELPRSWRSNGSLWQEDTFDHILRSPESYGEKWNYVRENPVHAGLCTGPEDWPWQGELSRLVRR